MKNTLANLEIEKLILGSIMRYPDHLATVQAGMEAEDFSADTHQRIYRAALKAAEEGLRVELPTVAEILHRTGDDVNIGGLGYLCSLADGLPNLPDIHGYVRLVREKSITRRMCMLAMRFIQECEAGAERPETIWQLTQAEILEAQARRQESTLLSVAQIIEREGGMNAFLSRSARHCGIRTGFAQLDMLIGGMQQGGIYVIGARPRVGKTTWALNVAANVAEMGEGKVLIFSMEMGDVSLVDRLICERAGVSLARFSAGRLGDQERRAIGQAAGELAAHGGIVVDHKSITNVGEIHAKIKSEQQRGKVALVVIDYLQLMLSGDERHRVAEMSRISRDLKVMMREAKVPALVLSQLSRAVDERGDHRPQLSDLRESGAIEQDADLVGFLYREDVYRRADVAKDGLAELIIAKHRHGPQGATSMTFRGDIMRFTELAQ